MERFTIAELTVIMKQAAGEVEVGDRDVADVTYLDLGYDSLALLEISARIKQTLGVQVPDAALTTSATPADTVAAVNQLIAPAEVTA
jgi:act minimal PKS acyl carrier protein